MGQSQSSESNELHESYKIESKWTNYMELTLTNFKNLKEVVIKKPLK